MTRLMSVALTEDAVRARTKTVTRRVGWLNLKAGDHLILCRRAMGVKRELQVRIAEVEVLSVRREGLDTITAAEVELEGFAGHTVEWFVEFFTTHMRVPVDIEVTRIEWRYIDGAPR